MTTASEALAEYMAEPTEAVAPERVRMTLTPCGQKESPAIAAGLLNASGKATFT